MKRRSFVGKAGTLAVAASVGLNSSLAGRKVRSKEDSKVGYAIVGLGFFASYVVPRVLKSDHSKVVAFVSSDRSKAKTWAQRYGVDEKSVYDYSEFDTIATNPEIDAIYVATPVGTHAEFALKAFQAGKHVLTEKTMASSVAECQEMIQAAKKADKKLMVAYRARYESYNKQMIEFARQESYGKVSSIAAHKGFNIGDKLGKNKWRTKKALAGGGALVDIGIYSIQACRYIAGVEPTEVSGFIHNTEGDERFNEVEENVSFMLRFPNGILATGSASWSYSLQNRYRVGAANGYFELEPATSNGNLRMTVKETDPTFIGERFFPNIDQIAAEFDHFSQCILNDEDPLTHGEEGLKDLKVIEAIYQSAKTNTVVKL